MPNENAEQGEQIGIGMFAVGFFDLLGQQERLRSIRGPLVTDDVQAKQQVKDAMTETYNAVWAMRNDFGSAFNAYTRNSNTVDLAALTEAQRAEFATLVSEPIRFRGFSDSMVAYLPLRTQEN